jgi:hypothetical protein
MILRRILLSAAAYVLVVLLLLTALPSPSQAIPAFSRQTGEVCSKCHFLTFPALNDYGREFKRRAYTFVREEALVERNGTLSIPVVLNASLVINAKYTNSTTNGVAPAGPGYTNGTWSLPLEAPLLVAGRLGRNVGFFGSLGRLEGTSANGQFAKNWKVMSSFAVHDGGFRIGMNLFNTAYGWTAGLETTNVFGQHGGVLNGANVTALTNIGMTKLNMQGVTLWAGNHLWTIGLSAVVPDVYNKAGKSNFGTHMIPGVRLAFTPTFMGWDVDIGGGMLNGAAGSPDPTTGKRLAGAHMDFLDTQIQGEIHDVGIGIYADYAYTIAKSGVKYNLFGAAPLEIDSAGALIGGDAGAGDRTGGWSLRAMVKPVEGWIFGGGYGRTHNKTVAGEGSDSRIWNIGIIREIYANAELKLLYGEQKVGARYPTNTAGYTQTTKSTTLQFEALM